MLLNNKVDDDDTDVTESEDERKERRSRRQVKPSLRFDEEYGYYCNYCDALNPSDFHEVTTCSEATKRKEAMDSEMDSLVKNQIWTLVIKPPKDNKILDVK